MNWLDAIGKLVGLGVSVVFCLAVVVALLAGGLNNLNPATQQMFWAIFIVLGGPIPYFFTNAVNDRADLNTSVGKFTLAGGYVVTVLAFVLVNALIRPAPCPECPKCPDCPACPEPLAWRKCVLDNDVYYDDIPDAKNIKVKNLDPNGSVHLKPPVGNQERVEFYCCFDLQQKTMKVVISIPDESGHFKRMEVVVQRDGVGAQSFSVRTVKG